MGCCLSIAIYHLLKVKKDKNMKDKAKIVAALLVGAAAGAALGILLAPDKGDETRKDITDFFAELVEATKERAQTKANNIKDYGNNVYNNAKSKFSGIVHGASEHGDEVIDAAKEKAGKVAGTVRNHAHEAVDHVKSKIKNGSNDVNDAIQDA
jgi:gas vesicle protein